MHKVDKMLLFIVTVDWLLNFVGLSLLLCYTFPQRHYLREIKDSLISMELNRVHVLTTVTLFSYCITTLIFLISPISSVIIRLLLLLILLFASNIAIPQISQQQRLQLRRESKFILLLLYNEPLSLFLTWYIQTLRQCITFASYKINRWITLAFRNPMHLLFDISSDIIQLTKKIA